jgi:hypothetical protein
MVSASSLRSHGTTQAIATDGASNIGQLDLTTTSGTFRIRNGTGIRTDDPRGVAGWSAMANTNIDLAQP